MEPKCLNTIFNCALLTGLTLCVLFGTKPTSAVDIHAPAEVIVENGTTGILKCTFKSKEVVSSAATVTWSFRSSRSETPSSIFYFSNGKEFPGPPEFKDRVQFIGDLNRKDASIQLSQAQFSDNGTYYCDVKNPPDIIGTPARTELRVVLKESLPQDNTAVIIGAVCGAVIGVILIGVVTCLIIKRHHTRHDYEGCTSLESVSSHAPQPRKKVESSLEGSRCSSPSGPLQGPVIYAQLDHSGSKNPNSFRKMEPVVYADIRKN
ncbi:myelin protein zero-like 1 like [Myripristis murdjan]|uniref:Myelin protein zero-like 1 like n=1 Tax=Myripristis murdjan TaxID=586833 RepID=A0A667XN27_9TELE|nr:myelin protein zero-like protein 1 [Myripristis murdjan]